MEEAIYIKGIKEAAPMGWNGSYADGRNSQSLRLPVTVVSSHINLSAIDHSKVASDINGLASYFLALCAKALSNAYVNVENVDFHTKMLIRMLESQERLVKSTSSAFFLKKVEHLQRCKCSKLTSIKERTLKAQHFPMQRYRLFSLLQHLFNRCVAESRGMVASRSGKARRRKACSLAQGKLDINALHDETLCCGAAFTGALHAAQNN